MTRGCSLFVFAHQDDEYPVTPLIASELRDRAVLCLFLTDGRGKGVSSETRDAESRKVLASIGVPGESLLFVGSQSGIPDGHLVEQLEPAFEAAAAAVAPIASPIDRLYMPAWEGGHQDHDAAHLVGMALAKRLGVDAWEFALYNGQGTPWKFFRAMKLLRSGTETRELRISLRDALRASFRCRHYKSQLKTWVGLFPESFLRFVLLRRVVVQRPDPRRLALAPHQGRLLYERMFAYPSARFAEHASRFAELHRLYGENQ